MKKLALLGVFLLTLCMGAVLTADAESNEDYEYTYVEDGNVEITGYKGNSATLNIPAELCGCPVTEIGECAFDNYNFLTSVIIPDSVLFIDRRAFFNCDSLTSVTIPDSVRFIDDSAFSYCESLESLTIPDSVTYIGDQAFSGCKSLTSVTIPDSVTSIGSWTFYCCTVNLTLIFSRVSYAEQYAIEQQIKSTN